MNFLITIATLLFAVVSSIAQGIQIGNIENGDLVTAGSDLTVMTVRQNTISSSDEVAVVIAIGCVSCPDLGSVLYNGPFSPVEPNPNPLHQEPHQNLSVQIPAVDFDGEATAAALKVVHFNLLGALLTPNIEQLSVNVTIV